MARGEPRSVAILGAGPVGLEAAIRFRAIGWPVTVYEKGDIAEHIKSWGHVRLFSPFSQNSSDLGVQLIRQDHSGHELPAPGDIVTGNDFRNSYLLPLAMTTDLADRIQSNTTVVGVGRSGFFKSDPMDDPKRATAPFRLLLRDGKGHESVAQADLICDCTGTFSKPAWLGDGGLPAMGEIAARTHIPYVLEDVLSAKKNHYAGRSVIVVGSGYSAATTVARLAELAEDQSATWTIWLTRAAKSTPLQRIANDPYRERDRLAAKVNNLATRGDGNVEFFMNTLIDEIHCHGADKGFRVCARTGGKSQVWEVDRVIGNVGYLADEVMTRELHIEKFADGKIFQPEPNYFVLGMKSMGRSSNFLMQQGYEQVGKLIAHLKKN
ncbi:MAG: monooxygenase [Zavarzinella sp.]